VRCVGEEKGVGPFFVLSFQAFFLRGGPSKYPRTYFSVGAQALCFSSLERTNG
jgi:hypothetical protein